MPDGGLPNWRIASGETILQALQANKLPVESVYVGRQLLAALDEPNLSPNQERALIARGQQMEAQEKGRVIGWVNQESFDLDKSRQDAEAKVATLMHDLASVNASLAKRQIPAAEGIKIIADGKKQLFEAKRHLQSLEARAQNMAAIREDPHGYNDTLYAKYPALKERRPTLT